MHHVAVALDLEQFVNRNASVFAHGTEIVAPEIDEHHVLRAFFLVRQQLRRDRRVVIVVTAARARSGQRTNASLAPLQAHQKLG